MRNMMCNASSILLIVFGIFVFQWRTISSSSDTPSIPSSSNIDSSLTSGNNTKMWYYPPGYAGNEARWRTTGAFDKELFSQTAEFDPVANKTNCKGRFYRSKRKSQFAEDVWLYEHWFYGVKDGIALESGAYQGLAMSNTYMFQNYAGWKSIHIEGDPFNYEKLVKNRPESLNIHAALCNETRELHYLTGGADTTRGFYEFMSEKFIKDWHGGVIKQENIIPVQCHPVTDILRHLHIKHVDIWFLDVEGAEVNVLMGTDFSAIKFNAIVMECDHYHQDRNQIKQHILKKHHFHCVHLGMTCFCKHNSYIPSETPCGFSV